MRLANDGRLANVDLFDKQAGPGPNQYDGWSGVKKSCLTPSLPMLPLLRQFSVQRPAGQRFQLTAAGAEAAARLHAEAELAGNCSCGLVGKARHAEPPQPKTDVGGKPAGGRGAWPHGLRLERLPTVCRRTHMIYLHIPNSM